MGDCGPITGLKDGQPATFADYEALFDTCERPRKFSAHEVGFTVLPNSLQGQHCEDCRHWFVNGIDTRAVCEIMRLKDELPVPAVGTCRFQNRDGANYPLLHVL